MSAVFGLRKIKSIAFSLKLFGKFNFWFLQICCKSARRNADGLCKLRANGNGSSCCTCRGGKCYLAIGEWNGLRKESSGFHRRLFNSKVQIAVAPRLSVWFSNPSIHPSSVQCGFASQQVSKVSIYLWLASSPKNPSNTWATILFFATSNYSAQLNMLLYRRAPDLRED